MKKTLIVFVFAALVVFTSMIWFFTGDSALKAIEIVPFGVLIIVVLFAVFIGYRRLTGIRRGEPAEDELSKKVMQKTSSLSYYISLYLWLAIMFVADSSGYEAHTLLAAGILGMALVFAVCWIVVNIRGIRNE